jgi:hypothetical protein
MIRPGDIGFGGKRTGFYPNAVRWFTKSRWSHCFVVMPPYMGEICVLEADLKVQLVTFKKEYVEKNADYYEIWRPIATNESKIYKACSELFMQDAGEIYGFMQIPWFALRAMLGWIGIHLKKNPFPSGEICSETPWRYIMALGGEYAKAISHLTEEECSPQDIYEAVIVRPDLFQLVLTKD